MNLYRRWTEWGYVCVYNSYAKDTARKRLDPLGR